jgi:hypothetical protein
MEEKKTILDEAAVAKKNRFRAYEEIGFHIQSVSATKEELVAFAKKTWEITKDVLHSDIALLDRILAHVQVYTDSIGRELEEFDATKPPPILAPTDNITDDSSMEERLEAIKMYKDFVRVAAQAQKSRTEWLAKISEALIYGTMLEGSDGQCTALGCARWCNNGFPQVTMGHKYCSYLMASTMSPEAADYVKAPWNAFIIEVPNDILFLTDGDTNQEHMVRRILVLQLTTRLRGEERWGYVAFTESTLTLWRYGGRAQRPVRRRHGHGPREPRAHCSRRAPGPCDWAAHHQYVLGDERPDEHQEDGHGAQGVRGCALASNGP